MSTRPVLPPQIVINAGNMSGDLVSLPTILNQMDGAGYYVDWTGSSPVGTVSVEASGNYSLNPDGSVANAGTWNALILNVGGNPSSTISISGNTGSEFIDVTVTKAWALRLIYTAGSGTGSLTARISARV